MGTGPGICRLVHHREISKSYCALSLHHEITSPVDLNIRYLCFMQGYIQGIEIVGA